MKINQKLSSFVLPLLLFLVAFAIRFPYSQDIPRFSSNELRITLELVHGERFPLFNQHPHIGALSNYIHAIGFWIFGLHYWVPRFLAVIFGAATIPLVFFLGRRLFGTPSGLLAAMLLIFSLYHVYFISHAAWSNCLTPFFVLLTLLLFIRALQEKSVWSMIAAAFTFGLAQQTHPSVITLLPAFAVVFALQGKENAQWWLRNKYFYLVLPAAALGCFNLLYYNVFHHQESVRYVRTGPQYALEKHPGFSSFLLNLGSCWVLLLRLLAGEIETKPAWMYWLSPALILCVIGVFVGIYFSIREKKWELPVLLLVPMMIIPIFNHGYDFCVFGRYLGFLIPIGLIIFSFFAIKLLHTAREKFSNQKFLVSVLWCALPLCLIAFHLWMMSQTYTALLAAQNSDIFLRTHQVLDRYDRKQTSVLLDPLCWHARFIKVFLESDGWYVEDMAEVAKKQSGRVVFSSENFDELQEQLQNIASKRPKTTILAITSPVSLKPFLTQTPIVSMDDCLAGEPPPDRINVYTVLTNNVYFLFRLSPQKLNIPPSDEPLLSFQKIRESIPDDLTVAIRGRSHGRLPHVQIQHAPLNNLAQYFQRYCTKLPERLQGPANICPQKED